MVKNLVALRLLTLRNSLMRRPWQLVLVIFGALYGAGILIFALTGLAILGAGPVDLLRTIVVIGGSAAVLGWAILPLAAAGSDQTLNPKQLVTFPIPLNTLMLGIGVSGILGVPGIVTSVVSLGLALAWIGQPAVALAAAACGAIGAVTCVVLSRLIAAASAALVTRRRFRELSGILVFIPLVLLGPALLTVMPAARDITGSLAGVERVLAWTPIGAIWAVPFSMASGDAVGAVLRLLIGLATLAVLVLAWRRSLAVAMVAPTHSGSRTRARGKLGVLGLARTPAQAVLARCLIYWRRDPRYIRQILVVPLVPVLMVFYGSAFESPGFAIATGPVMALLLSIATVVDVSYDSTAFALHISTGLSGRADRWGRAAAVLTFGAPAIVVFVIASCGFANAWDAIPGMLGLSIGVLLSGLAVASVTSARFIFPVPLPGQNPFSSRQAGGLAMALIIYACWAVIGGLSVPELTLAIVGGVTGNPLFGWLGLVVGLLLGAGLLWTGVVVGARALERNAVGLLADTRKEY